MNKEEANAELPDYMKTEHQILLKMLRITQDNQVMLLDLVKQILNKDK